MPIIAPPTFEPVTLDDVKLHIHEDGNEHDPLLTVLIKAARQQAEQRTGRRFGEQAWNHVIDSFPPWTILLPDPPVTGIISIRYDDPDGVEQLLDVSAYTFRPAAEPAAVLPLKSWPATFAGPGAVRIRYMCGLDATDGRWESLRAWMLIAVGTWFANREAIIKSGGMLELPHAFWDGLLDPLRFYGRVTV